MEILVVNPNTTASMTEKIRTAAIRAASPGTRITAVNSATGPESIEGYYDEALAVPGLLAEIAKGEARAVDGHVIACFDDTGLDAARALARAPVVGIGEAGFHELKRNIEPSLEGTLEAGWSLLPVAHGKGSASGVQREAVEFLGSSDMAHWMTAAIDGG